MSSEGPREPGIEMPRAGSRSRRARRFQTGVRGLILAVACCGAVSWSARTIWESRHPAAAEARGLESGDPARRSQAARDLMVSGINDPGLAVPPLIAALGDPEVEVRIAAIEALGAIEAEGAGGGSAGELLRDATRGLIRSLNDRELSVRLAAIDAVMRAAATRGTAGPIEARAAIDALVAMIGDGDDRVRWGALDALAISGPSGPVDPPPDLVAALRNPSASDRAKAIKAIAGFRAPMDPWLPWLLRGLEHEEPEVQIVCWAIFSRARPPAFSAGAIPALVAALGSRAGIVRDRAAKALEPHARDPGAVIAIPALLALLREPSGVDRGDRVLTALGDDGPRWDPARVAAGLLGKIAPGTPAAGEVVAALTDAVRSADPLRRQSAIEALGEFGPAAEPAIPALIQILCTDLSVRPGHPLISGFLALGSLGRIAPGTKSEDAALAAVVEALDSRSMAALDLRFATLEALAAFGAKAEIALPRLRALQDGADAQLKLVASRVVEAVAHGGSADGRGGAANGRPGPAP